MQPLLLQICMKKLNLVRVGYEDDPLFVKVEEVLSWSPWSSWELDFRHQREQRSRVCCSQNCSGEAIRARPMEGGEYKVSKMMKKEILS